MPGPAAKPQRPPDVSASRLLRYNGAAHLRQRLVLSLLAHKPVRIDQIRPDDEEPGLKDYEVSFLRLLERISNGTVVEISYTGTSLLFNPGTLTGGVTSPHTCPLSRSVGWFLEPLLALAPFCKKELVITLLGITTDGRDASVDTLRTSLLPHLALFLESADGMELRITKRGHPPLGGGEITFRCPPVKRLKPSFDFTQPGKVIRIRGIAHSVRVSPQISNRLVSSARSVLNRFIPDIFIYADVYRGEESGKSPGYALTLLATSTTGVLHSAEVASGPDYATPEDAATAAATALLGEMAAGGCIDRGGEALVLTLMALGGEDIRRCRLAGPLDAFAVQHLRDLRDYFSVAFKVKEEANEHGQEEVLVSCVGTGYSNIASRAG